MKKIIYSVLTLALLQTGMSANAAFDNSSLHGSYGYSLSGQFGTNLENTIIELGRFRADGVGHLKARGTAVINGVTVLHPKYDCSYTINPKGTGETLCDRTDETGTVVGQTFKLVIDAHLREVRVIALPLANSPFATVSAIGDARKQ